MVKRWHESGQLAAVLLLLGLISFLFLTLFYSGYGDFLEFHIASSQFLHRLNPYDSSVYPAGFKWGFPYPPLAILLTLLPALFTMPVATRVWDIICLLLYAISVDFWIKMIWGKALSFPRYVRIFISTFSFCTIWAFWLHHLIVPVLFFSTLAWWFANKPNREFVSGLFAGLMLLKPHLTLLAVFALYQKSVRRRLFLLGMGISFLGPFLPFVSGFRPVSDLKGWTSAAHLYAMHEFYLDEQSISAACYRIANKGLIKGEFTFTGHIPNRLHLKNGNGAYNRLKMLFLFVGFLAGVYILTKKETVHVKDYSLALMWGILISFYSHCYDSALCTPLFILGIHSLESRSKLKLGWLLFAPIQWALALSLIIPMFLVQFSTLFIALIWYTFAFRDMLSKLNWSYLRRRPEMSLQYKSGQATTEFILMMLILTFLGVYFANTMTGPNRQSGAISNAETNSIQSISSDEK